MKKVLITGSSGFIGRNLKEQLSNKYEVFSPIRNELDLLNQEMVREYLKKHSFDIIIHSANTNDRKYELTEYDILNQNLQMFYNLETCSELYEKMYYFGSGAEYDMRHYQPKMKETYFGTFIPQDPYGFAKYTMSRVVDKHQNIYDLRLFGVYGKYEEWKKRFISNNLCRSIKGLSMTLSKNMFMDYLYIDDLVKIMEWFLTHEPKYRHYNICTGHVIDLFSIAERINLCTGLERTIQVFEEGWKPEYSGDNSLLMKEMGEFQFTMLDDAIKELYHYYKMMEQEIYFCESNGELI